MKKYYIIIIEKGENILEKERTQKNSGADCHLRTCSLES